MTRSGPSADGRLHGTASLVANDRNQPDSQVQDGIFKASQDHVIRHVTGNSKHE
jgi:hypothetical protein